MFLDSELQMKVHVNKLVSICYYHLRRLFQLRSFVSQDVMKHLVTALVLARIDSCNSVLVRLVVKSSQSESKSKSKSSPLKSKSKSLTFESKSKSKSGIQCPNQCFW